MLNFFRGRNSSNSNVSSNSLSNISPEPNDMYMNNTGNLAPPAPMPVQNQQQQQMPMFQQQQQQMPQNIPPPTAPPAPSASDDAEADGLFSDIYSSDPIVSTKEVTPVVSGDGVVSVKGLHSREYVSKGEAMKSHATIDIQTSLIGDKVKRQPFELTVCLDTSGSMSGAPIETAKKTIIEMLDQLCPGDLLNFITYSNDATIKFKDITFERKAWAKEEVTKVRAGGGTNIQKGLEASIELFEKSEAPEEAQRAIFLLSDGHPNGGTTSASGLGEVAATACKTRARVSSIGIGNSYNEDVLRAICDAGEGDYLHVRTTANISECIAAAFQGLTTSLGTEAVLFLENTEQALITKVENYTMEQLSSGLNIGILRQDNLRQVMLHLDVRATEDVGTMIDLVRFKFQYKSGITEKLEVVEGTVQACVTDDPKDLLKLNMDVVVAYRLMEVGNANQVIKEAVDSNQRGKAMAMQRRAIAVQEKVVHHDRSRKGKVSNMLRSMRETQVEMEKPNYSREAVSKRSAFNHRCQKQQEEWMYELA